MTLQSLSAICNLAELANNLDPEKLAVYVVSPVHFVPLAARIASVRINIESARNCDTFGSFKTRKTRKLFIHTAVVLAAQYHSLRFLLFGDQLQGGNPWGRSL